MFYHIIVPVADMRATPHQFSEMVSQALFGEEVFPLEEHKEWVKIATGIDNYQGWVKRETFCSRNTSFLKDQPQIIVNRLAAHLYHVQDTIYGPFLTLPFESRLIILENSHPRWLTVILPDQQKAYIQRGDITFDFPRLDRQEICEFSQNFLGIPYTWGGRSSFGYDCSGFVQMLYRKMGLLLPRDSKDQFAWPRFSAISPQKTSFSDLLFFGYSSTDIRHVGMSLGEGKFIHTCAVVENAPYCRISHLTNSAWNGSGVYPFLAARTVQRD